MELSLASGKWRYINQHQKCSTVQHVLKEIFRAHLQRPVGSNLEHFRHRGDPRGLPRSKLCLINPVFSQGRISFGTERE